MKISLIADGFTGASNIALTLAEADMPVTQFIGVPASPADRDLGAGVVVLKMRTSPVSEAIETSLGACEWLLVQGARQIILKVVSTFSKNPNWAVVRGFGVVRYGSCSPATRLQVQQYLEMVPARQIDVTQPPRIGPRYTCRDEERSVTLAMRSDSAA